MDIREKLVELLDDIQLRGEDFTDYEIYGMRLPDTISNEDVASHLIAHGVTVSDGALPVADAATERSAAVDEIEDQRKPEDFIGHRKPEQEWIPVTERLPEPYTRVLTYVQSYGRQAPHIVIDQIIVLPAGTHIWASGSASWKTETTHWMPLPEPPKEVE